MNYGGTVCQFNQGRIFSFDRTYLFEQWYNFRPVQLVEGLGFSGLLFRKSNEVVVAQNQMEKSTQKEILNEKDLKNM